MSVLFVVNTVTIQVLKQLIQLCQMMILIEKFLFGLTAGAGLSTCRYDYNSVTPPPSFSFRIAPTAGLTMDWRMSRSFSMQMNIMYKEKGDKIDMSKWIDDILESDTVQSDGKIIADGSITTKLAYIEASLIPTITIANLVEIGAGGFLGYGLSGKEITDYSIKYENYGFPFPDETYNEEKKVKYILIAPSRSFRKRIIYQSDRLWPYWPSWSQGQSIQSITFGELLV